ncbi:hypothetical protein UFOVP257_21 [uncultured Caudovirales phage]|uniref:Uncharacterized protein n=1 Tax=uncultured Caudovirales phage TaxID=2100421 RepID=A0A6J5LHZ7_9CAUD|nr:hypothetical protein UFOVP257_21 [uncultured Caudovirales phage]
MARKTILETYYTFTPSTKTIVIPRAIPRERLVLITNVSTNQVIFNFSDASLKETSHTIATDATGNTTTTIVLQYNTASMTSTDKLQIIIDEFEESFKPSELYTDPVNKFRVSQPQALIDTDFEYGSQSTKWESLSMINNRPMGYYSVTAPLTVTNISVTNGSRSVTVATTTPPGAGSIVYIQDTLWAAADGVYVVDSSVGGTSFSYTAKVQYTGTSGSILDPVRTNVYVGNFYSNAAIGISSIGFSGNNVNVVTSIPHGLVVGNEIALTGTNQSNANGSWVVATIGNSTSFNSYVTTAPAGAVTGGTLYARPVGQFLHRAFDGGVQFSTFAQSHNQQMIRQTRRYFRYQSGKGIQMSTGTILKPNINVDYLQGFAGNTTVILYTKQIHNVNPGVTIAISGANESAYNGTFTVATVLDPYRLTYTANAIPSATVATGLPVMSVTSWYNAGTRLGMFDNQNGIFFDFDGQTLSTGRRSSTYQISGFANIAIGSNQLTGAVINGVGTNFSKQLQPNDFIVIRGMPYRIVNITSDTSANVTPAYRGLTNANLAIVSKTVDRLYPQNTWNIDRCDGTGPSGFNIDLSRMQMFYMDYSWYGAGFIRWGFRGPTGDIIYCHKIANNNINYEAYMRSGNLPARYETNTFSKTALLATSAGSTDTTLYLSDTTNWPPSGTALIKNASQAEYVNYTGLGATATLSMTVTSGSPILTGTSTTGVVVGQYVQGTGIPYGTTVISISAGASVTLSQPAVFSGTQTIKFSPTLTGVTRGSPGVTQLVTQTANVATVTAANTINVQQGMYVIGTGIPENTFVYSVTTNTSVVLSQAPTSSTTQAMIFAPMAQSPQTWTYSTTAPIAVEAHSPSFAPTISHWGTSVIMDGRYDDDKSLVFTQGMTTLLGVASAGTGQTIALQSFRVAPTVSSGISGTTLGSREIINRMQMVLRQMDVLTNGQFLIQLVLNGQPNVATPAWSSVGGSSLAQYVNHTGNTIVTGGETIFGFYLNTGAGGTNYQATQQDLVLVRDLGTSILSGGQANVQAAIYPDGPDIITVTARNIGSSGANVFARMSWTEAQA